MDSIADKKNTTENQKEEERNKVRGFRKNLLKQNTKTMTLEDRVKRLEDYINGESS